jgi:hypothetical protein
VVLARVMAAGANLLRLHVLGIELQDSSGLMIGPHHGMRQAHCEYSFSSW